MPKKSRASVVLALSAMFLLGCGAEPDSASADGAMSEQASSGCTERDGAWFGRSESGSFISSQTQEACEARLSQ